MGDIDELDQILAIFENPIRRRIIQRLTESPNFALQLSKELRLAQQLVAKHLHIMEEQGLVGTRQQDSPRGPKRKLYMLKRHLSIRLDVAPNLFSQELKSFKELNFPPKPEITLENVRSQLKEIQKKPLIPETLTAFRKILEDIDQALDRLTQERTAFLFYRNQLMKYSTSLMKGLSPIERGVLIRIIKNPSITIEEISRQLNLHRDYVEAIMIRLKSLDTVV